MPIDEFLPDEDDSEHELGPDIPKAPNYENREVDAELQRKFWSLVLLFNIALMGLSLGVMLIGFERRWQFGGGLIAVGLLALVRGLLRYRNITNDDDPD